MEVVAAGDRNRTTLPRDVLIFNLPFTKFQRPLDRFLALTRGRGW